MKKPDKDLTITSPFGDFILDTELLNDTFNYLANNLNKSDRVDRSVSRFFDCEPEGLECKEKYWNSKEYIYWAHSLMEVLNREWELIKTENYNYGNAPTAAIWREEKVNDTTIKIPHKALLFLQHREDNTKIVIKFTPFDEYELDVQIYFQQDKMDYTAFWELVESHFYNEGLLKNASFDAQFGMLNIEPLDWDSIIIKSEDRQMIDRNICNFIGMIEFYQSKGLRGSRGVLVTGPPGTGKTLACKVVMNKIDATIIYIARNAIAEVGAITSLYKLARKLAPSLIIIEDIDTLGGFDRRERDNPLLGEFLNCLSGVEENSGVITFATSNYPEDLDWALTDRPGRFDVRVNFGYPDKDARKSILEKYIEPFDTTRLDLDCIANRTDNFSGAYLQEIIQLAFMLSIEEGNKSISQTHMDDALKSLTSQRREATKEKGLFDGEQEELWA